jgi:hypothetical protein
MKYWSMGSLPPISTTSEWPARRPARPARWWKLATVPG